MKTYVNCFCNRREVTVRCRRSSLTHVFHSAHHDGYVDKKLPWTWFTYNDDWQGIMSCLTMAGCTRMLVLGTWCWWRKMNGCLWKSMHHLSHWLLSFFYILQALGSMVTTHLQGCSDFHDMKTLLGHQQVLSICQEDIWKLYSDWAWMPFRTA